MAKMEKKKKLLATGTVLTAVALLASSSFAWYTSSQSVTNKLETADFRQEITEDFIPPEEWKPGEIVNKDVIVTNIGTGDAVVRVRLEEVLKLLETENDDIKLNETTSRIEGNKPAMVAAQTLANLIDSKGGVDKWKVVSSSIQNTAADSAVVVLQKKVSDSSGDHYDYLAFRQVDSGDQDDPATPTIQDYASLGLTVGDESIAYESMRVDVSNCSSQDEETRLEQIQVLYQSYTPKAPILDVHTFTAADLSPYHEKIRVALGADVTDLETANTTGADQGKWVYDDETKCFYFDKVIRSGVSTPKVLDSITLDKTVTNEYKNMYYDITVCMQGIQNSKEQVAGDWGQLTPAGSLENLNHDIPAMDLTATDGIYAFLMTLDWMV